MRQEDKELLLKDLCARLPYGVIVRHADSLIDSDGNDTGRFWYKHGYLCDVCTLDDMTTTIIESEGSDEEGYEHICDLEKSLPYLRPRSSIASLISAKEWSSLGGIELIDWYNANHIDYRGLISKGLAVEVTEENNPYKE